VTLNWTSWTGSQALATGQVTWNVCMPDCAESSTWDSSAASFELTDVTPVGGRMYYEKLVVDVTGYIPPSFPNFMRHQSFPENPQRPV
jgi:hypothetical protein